MPQRICLLVLGMHRSGTSAMTRILNLLGADLPATLLGAKPGNPRGHWESAPLAAHHDRLLDQLGSRWDDWRKLDPSVLLPRMRDEAARAFAGLLRGEYGASPLFVLKDPRLCRLVPYMVELLASEGAATRHVLMLRNPLAVAASLQERDGITPAFSMLMWLRHMLDGEAATRRAPRAIVSYENLLLDWRAALHAIGARVGLKWPSPIEVTGAEVDAFLSTELQHHAPSYRELDARSDVAPWIKEVYTALRTLERNPDNEAAMHVLDAVGADFDRVAPVFAETMLSEIAARERRSDAGLTQLAEVAILRQELAAANARTAQAELEREQLCREVETGKSELASARSIIEGLKRHNTALLESTSWRLTQPLRDLADKYPSIRRAVRASLVRAGHWPRWAAMRKQQLFIAGSLLGARLFAEKQPHARVAGPTELLGHFADGIAFGIPPDADFPGTFSLRSFRPEKAVALVVHVFYEDLWPDLRQAIRNIPVPFDLFVTLVRGHSDKLIGTITSEFPQCRVLTMPNHGRDIYPFVFLANTGVLCSYALICKLHSKRSPHRTDGAAWGKALLQSLVGDPTMVRAIIERFSTDPDLGIVAADGSVYSSSHWGSNLHCVSQLASRLQFALNEQHLEFAAGSMFWIHPLIIRMVQSLHLTQYDFEAEAGQVDGTMAHAVERFIGVVARQMGMRIAEAGSMLATAPAQASGVEKVRLIAFYLPQFHPIPENDHWWGAGFTEWTSVSAARSLYQGHHQPRQPADLGFYDLRVAEVREAQARLAREYGVSAFCYYYYWFEGRRLLERPLEEMLASGSPDFPFCLCWANENWTRRWDGLSRDILIAQRYTPDALRRFAFEITRYFKDPRYLRHRGEPVFLVYRMSEIPAFAKVAQEWRRIWRENGVGAVHLCAVRFHTDSLPLQPKDAGVDAYVEFPPHGVDVKRIEGSLPGLAAGFAGIVYDYDAVVSDNLARHAHSETSQLHRGVMTGWDNTARRGDSAHICHGATPAAFRRWLRGTVLQEGAKRPGEEKLVFINAWNEWAEGAYLEPDKKYGRGYLEAVRSVRPRG